MDPSPIVSAVSSSSLVDAKLEEHRVSCGSTQCPSCGHKFLDRKAVWVGLPAGVKFDPTDQELIDHLEAKVKAQDLRSHPLIDEFIPTIEGEDGICYTHPEKLPGVTRGGLSRHFFHRPSRAYTTGTRKRRKIQSESKGETRWHKTGKTRPVVVNGQHKGCKKILVLYTNFGKHRKPEKTNWVMHQYHLGQAEEERDGELVVSKIFYQTQPRHCTAASAAAAAASVLQRGIMPQQLNPDSTGGGSGSYSSSSKELGIGKRSDEKLPSGYSGILGMPHHVIMKTDNIGFAPFRQTFSQVAMDEHVADVRTLHNYHHHHLAQVEQHQQQQQPVANFHMIGRTMNSAINFISSAPVLQQTTPMVLDDPYHVPRSMLQDRQQEHGPQQQQQQQQKLEHRSAAGLEELIVSCTSAGIKGEETSTPQSQATEWQYSYWPAQNQEHDRHPGH